MINIRNIAILLALACLVIPGGVHAQSQVAHGVVYHDANKNGVRDTSESPVDGVCVSNGIDIVKTDKTGSYELPVDDDTIVFVIKPRGWMTAIDRQNIPRFYYIHKPGRSRLHGSTIAKLRVSAIRNKSAQTRSHRYTAHLENDTPSETSCRSACAGG